MLIVNANVNIRKQTESENSSQGDSRPLRALSYAPGCTRGERARAGARERVLVILYYLDLPSQTERTSPPSSTVFSTQVCKQF